MGDRSRNSRGGNNNTTTVQPRARTTSEISQETFRHRNPSLIEMDRDLVRRLLEEGLINNGDLRFYQNSDIAEFRYHSPSVAILANSIQELSTEYGGTLSLQQLVNGHSMDSSGIRRVFPYADRSALNALIHSMPKLDDDIDLSYVENRFQSQASALGIDLQGQNITDFACDTSNPQHLTLLFNMTLATLHRSRFSPEKEYGVSAVSGELRHANWRINDDMNHMRNYIEDYGAEMNRHKYFIDWLIDGEDRTLPNGAQFLDPENSNIDQSFHYMNSDHVNRLLDDIEELCQHYQWRGVVGERPDERQVQPTPNQIRIAGRNGRTTWEDISHNNYWNISSKSYMKNFLDVAQRDLSRLTGERAEQLRDLVEEVEQAFYANTFYVPTLETYRNKDKIIRQVNEAIDQVGLPENHQLPRGTDLYDPTVLAILSNAETFDLNLDQSITNSLTLRDVRDTLERQANQAHFDNAELRLANLSRDIQEAQIGSNIKNLQCLLNRYTIAGGPLHILDAPLEENGDWAQADFITAVAQVMSILQDPVHRATTNDPDTPLGEIAAALNNVIGDPQHPSDTFIAIVGNIDLVARGHDPIRDPDLREDAITTIPFRDTLTMLILEGSIADQDGHFKNRPDPATPIDPETFSEEFLAVYDETFGGADPSELINQETASIVHNAIAVAEADAKIFAEVFAPDEALVQEAEFFLKYDEIVSVLYSQTEMLVQADIAAEMGIDFYAEISDTDIQRLESALMARAEDPSYHQAIEMKINEIVEQSGVDSLDSLVIAQLNDIHSAIAQNQIAPSDVFSPETLQAIADIRALPEVLRRVEIDGIPDDNTTAALRGINTLINIPVYDAYSPTGETVSFAYYIGVHSEGRLIQTVANSFNNAAAGEDRTLPTLSAMAERNAGLLHIAETCQYLDETFGPGTQAHMYAAIGAVARGEDIPALDNDNNDDNTARSEPAPQQATLPGHAAPAIL